MTWMISDPLYSGNFDESRNIWKYLFTSSRNIGSRCPPTVLQEGGTIGYEDKKAWIDTKCTDGWVTLAGPGELGNMFSALDFSRIFIRVECALTRCDLVSRRG